MLENSQNGKGLRVTAESLEKISDAGANLLIAHIEQYNLPAKSVGNLMRDVTQKLEEHFMPVTQGYVRERLGEQINLHIANGFHEYAGCTKKTFRELLAPLIEETMRFFAPPTKHPIIRGEFTILLVFPTRLIPLRRQLMTLMGETTPLSIPDFEMHTHGKVSPINPYVLVGIDGGRKLKDSPIIKADSYIAHHGYSYFAVHELIQLLLVRPEFLRSQSDARRGLLEVIQTSVLALGEKCSEGLVRLSVEKKPNVEKGEFTLDFLSLANTHAGMELGKPYYTTMITCEKKNTTEK